MQYVQASLKLEGHFAETFADAELICTTTVVEVYIAMVQEKADSDAAAAEGTSQMWVAQKYIEQPLIINRRYLALLLLMMCGLMLQSLVCTVRATHAGHEKLVVSDQTLQLCSNPDIKSTTSARPEVA